MDYTDETYVSGGFFLCKLASRPAWNDPEFVPPMLFSGSSEYCPRVPDAWAIEWSTSSYSNRDKRAAEARRFNISDEQLDEVIRWTTHAHNEGRFGWPGVFFSTQTAREFASRFLADSRETVLLEMCLRQTDVEEFLEYAKPRAYGEAPSGHYAAVSCKRLSGYSGTSLGYDVLGTNVPDFYSWLCHSMEKEIASSFSARVNEFGLFSDILEANRVCDFCNDESTGAEPVLWLPWLLISHDIW